MTALFLFRKRGLTLTLRLPWGIFLAVKADTQNGKLKKRG